MKLFSALDFFRASKPRAPVKRVKHTHEAVTMRAELAEEEDQHTKKKRESTLTAGTYKGIMGVGGFVATAITWGVSRVLHANFDSVIGFGLFASGGITTWGVGQLAYLIKPAKKISPFLAKIAEEREASRPDIYQCATKHKFTERLKEESDIPYEGYAFKKQSYSNAVSDILTTKIRNDAVVPSYGYVVAPSHN